MLHATLSPSALAAAPAVSAVLWGLAGWLGLGALIVTVWSAQSRAALGKVEVHVRRRLGVRVGLLVAYVATAAAALSLSAELPRAPLALDFALGLYVLLVSPGFQDSKFGASGVQRGWHARRFAELEEWRLTGDHLRWKLFGTWVASDLPKERHAAAREKLVAVAADRESRFSQ